MPGSVLVLEPDLDLLLQLFLVCLLEDQGWASTSLPTNLVVSLSRLVNQRSEAQRRSPCFGLHPEHVDDPPPEPTGPESGQLRVGDERNALRSDERTPCVCQIVGYSR